MYLAIRIDICQYVDMKSVCCTPLSDPPLTPTEAEGIAGQLKAIADPTRLRIISLVSAEGEICQCDLEEPLGLSQPTVSHHLRVLTDAGLLHREKRGKWAFYRVSSRAMGELAGALTPPQASSTSSSMVSSK